MPIRTSEIGTSATDIRIDTSTNSVKVAGSARFNKNCPAAPAAIPAMP